MDMGGIGMIDGIGLGNIMVDCDDEQALRAFYQKLLGWAPCELYGRPGLKGPSGVAFLFIGEDDYAPPVWPEQAGRQQKQMHFDFQVPSVPEAVEEAQALGAALAAAQYGNGDFVTMIDPAGHPFCLCARDNPA